MNIHQVSTACSQETTAIRTVSSNIKIQPRFNHSSFLSIIQTKCQKYRFCEFITYSTVSPPLFSLSLAEQASSQLHLYKAFALSLFPQNHRRAIWLQVLKIQEISLTFTKHYPFFQMENQLAFSVKLLHIHKFELFRYKA